MQDSEEALALIHVVPRCLGKCQSPFWMTMSALSTQVVNSIFMDDFGERRPLK